MQLFPHGTDLKGLAVVRDKTDETVRASLTTGRVAPLLTHGRLRPRFVECRYGG